MKNKSDLKRKVLCSLLAASTMGIFYSSDALAASVNGETPKDGVTITNEFLTGEANSCKVVVGHGNVSIQTNAIVGEMLKNYQTGGLGAALNPSNDNQNVPVVGVVGGEIKITDNGKAMIGFAGKIVDYVLKTEFFTDDNLAKLDNIQSPENANITQDVTVTIGSTTVNPVVLGSFSSDLLIVGDGDNETLNRTGNVVENINSGNVIGGFGGSGAVSILGGTANTTLTGNIEKTVTGNANIGIHANGGLATTLLGGDTTSTVDGNTSLVIDTTTGEEGAIDALTVGVAGGGAALAIAGGNATSNVTGTTYVEVGGNGTAIGVIGGGVAGSIDISGDGSSSSNAITSTASTGRTHVVINFSKTPENSSALQAAVGNIKDGLTNDTGIDTNKVMAGIQGLVGQNSAIGVTGGGLAIANKSDNVGATVITNGTDIDLWKGYATGVFANGFALSTNYAEAIAEMTDTANINIEKDMHAVGVFGNGLAYFTGSSNGGTENLTGMATASAENTNINIKGYAEGVIGGGLAIDDSQSDTTNAKVETTGTATINVHDGATVEKLDFNGLKPLAGNRPSDGSIDMRSYVDAVENAAKDVAIAAGGVAVGGGAESTVVNAEVNIIGGTINGNVIAGGVAGYGYKEADKGAYVDNSTINLYSGEVKGNIYAGGSVSTDNTSNDKNYEKANAKVGNSIINLAGATVTGVLSGKGVSGTDNDKALKSFMNVSGENTLGLVDDNGTKVSKISAFNETNFSAGSVTTLDGGLEAGNTVAVINGKLSDTENGVITVADGAKLNISELTAGKGNTYLVASDYAEDSSLWANDALAYDRTENYAAINEDENGYKITYEEITDANVNEATDSFVDAIGENGEEIRNNIEGLLKDPRNTFGGFDKFMEDASTSGNYADVGKMAMIGEAAGVTSNTIDVAGDMADNSVLRLSFTQDDITGEPKVNEDGAIWAKYIHNKHDLDGMDSSFGDINSSSDFDGATIGVDFAKKGKVQSGIAFSYGSGDSHGMGINNDFDMWGVSLYGNVKNDDTNVIADIGFSESDNELTGTAMGKDIKADRDVSVFTVGVRAEKLYTNGSTQIVPYTGLRYYNVDPDSYTAYYDGQKFGEYDADRQNIWTLPVGVSLRNETVTESGWRLTPKVDVAYIWAFGDTDNSFDLNTGSGVDTLDYTVMDSGSWLGSVGFEAGKDDWAFGVGYSYQKGSHEEANKWFVNVEYSF